jgi:hypothetical protein
MEVAGSDRRLFLSIDGLLLVLGLLDHGSPSARRLLVRESTAIYQKPPGRHLPAVLDTRPLGFVVSDVNHRISLFRGN